MGVTENDRKCRYCGKKLGMMSPNKYCQDCAEEHSNRISDWKDEHLTNGHGDEPATSGYIRPEKKKGKTEEETHAMDKPKPLEVVSDGDLSEVKKDPVWKTWLEKISPSHNTHRGSTWHTGDEDSCPTCETKKKPEYDDEKVEATVSDSNKTYVTKPIPDSKGGRGSFQHCINANQDKRNPGGWCKQIERKIGKGLGALGEGKLNRKTGKPMKLKPRKITLDDFEYDDKPSYFKQVASEEKKKKEKKKAKNKRPPIKGISSYLQGPKKMEVTSPHGKGQQTGGKETGEGWQKYWDEHKDELLDYEKTQKKREAKEKTEFPMYKADYFVEEIRSNIIYHNKILPLVGMIAGQAARGMGKVGKKIGGELLEGASEVGQGMLQGVAEEEEE